MLKVVADIYSIDPANENMQNAALASILWVFDMLRWWKSMDDSKNAVHVPFSLESRTKLFRHQPFDPSTGDDAYSKSLTIFRSI